MLLRSDDYPAARRCSASRGPILLTIIRMLRSVSKKSLVPFFPPSTPGPLRWWKPRWDKTFTVVSSILTSRPVGVISPLHPYTNPGDSFTLLVGLRNDLPAFLGGVFGAGSSNYPPPTRVITLRLGAFGVRGPQRLPIWVYTGISWGKSCLEMEMNSCPLCHFFSFVTWPQPVSFLLSLVVLIRKTELKMRS